MPSTVERSREDVVKLSHGCTRLDVCQVVMTDTEDKNRKI